MLHRDMRSKLPFRHNAVVFNLQVAAHIDNTGRLKVNNQYAT